MSLSLEVLIKLFALAIGVLIFNKVVIPKIAELFVKNKYKSKNPKASLDHMIKLKINELSDNDSGREGIIKRNGSKKNVSPKDTILDYFKKLTEENTTPEKVQEAQWFIYLIEQLHWGDSEEIKDIQIELNKAFKSRFEITKITAVINKLIKEDKISFLAELNSPKIALINFIGLYSILSDTLSNNENTFIDKISSENKTTKELITMAIKCVIQLSKDYPIQAIYNSVLKNSSPLDKVDAKKMDEIIIDFCFIKGTNHPKHLSTFINELEKQIVTIKTILPLKAPKDKNDFSGALKVFGQDESSYNFNYIKKKQKKLLASAHPDRVAGLNLTGDLIKNAHNNFIIIQDAYEIIKKHEKKAKRSA